ncbi:hypothetical protein C8J57DRAFT_1262465 [Mycena rebaudengoi]|nr:hypothetical protein C8J57DRAFT_1262465 [Mycena rebaudengoi]
MQVWKLLLVLWLGAIFVLMVFGLDLDVDAPAGIHFVPLEECLGASDPEVVLSTPLPLHQGVVILPFLLFLGGEGATGVKHRGDGVVGGDPGEEENFEGSTLIIVHGTGRDSDHEASLWTGILVNNAHGVKAIHNILQHFSKYSQRSWQRFGNGIGFFLRSSEGKITVPSAFVVIRTES